MSVVGAYKPANLPYNLMTQHPKWGNERLVHMILGYGKQLDLK